MGRGRGTQYSGFDGLGDCPSKGSDTDTLGVSNQAFCGSKAAQDTHGVHQGGMVGVVHSLLWSLRSEVGQLWQLDRHASGVTCASGTQALA